MKKYEQIEQYQLTFDFLDDPSFNPDPVIDDIKIGYTKPKKEPYKRKTTDSQLNAIRKTNLNQTPAQFDLFHEQPAQFDFIDNSKRILTDIRPMEQIANQIPRTTSKIINGIKLEASNLNEAEKYLKYGSAIKDSLDNDDKITIAKNICEKWKMTSYKGVISDLAGGLLAQISQGEYFQGITPQFVYDPFKEKNVITSWLVKLNYAQLKKCTFGGIVDNWGNIKYGYADILAHSTEKDLKDFINGRMAEPRLLYFSKDKSLFGEYAPILIKDKSISGVILELDRRYFPFNFTDKGEPTSISESRYMKNIAGISSILEIGHNLLLKQYGDSIKLPATNIANRFYQILLGAYQFQSLLGISVRNQLSDKDNIIVRKDGIYNLFGCQKCQEHFYSQREYQNYIENHRIGAEIKIDNETALDIFPKDIKKRQWTEVQRKGLLIGETIIKGLKATGIFEELKNDKNAGGILIPSNQTNMQFLQRYDNALLAKVEPIKNLN